MKKANPKKNENVGLAEQHIQLAEQLILEENENADEEDKELFKNASFALEKAEADLEESQEN